MLPFKSLHVYSEGEITEDVQENASRDLENFGVETYPGNELQIEIEEDVDSYGKENS